MMLIPEIVFYIVFFLLINSFLIYPLVIYFISRNKNKHGVIQSYEPTVSILMAIDGDENDITEKIKKLGELDYDKTKLEILIGSNSTSTSVNEIISENEKINGLFKPLVFENKKSIPEILNELVGKANNEILVFLNAGMSFEKNILESITENFSEPAIGKVFGKTISIDNEKNMIEYPGKNIFTQYEDFIKQAEDKCGVVLNSNSEVFAIRKELYKPMSADVPVNVSLFLSLSIVEQGYKITCNDKAVAYKNRIENFSEDYNKKISSAVSDFYTLSFFKNLLWHKNKFLSYVFWSRAKTQLILPVLLLTLFLISFLLSNENLFIRKIYFLQLAFYLLALGGYLLSLIKVTMPIFSLPYSFVLSNAAKAEGFMRYRKEKQKANKLQIEINK